MDEEVPNKNAFYGCMPMILLKDLEENHNKYKKEENKIIHNLRGSHTLVKKFIK